MIDFQVAKQLFLYILLTFFR